LFELELPSFDTLIWNSKARFKRQVKNCCNGIIYNVGLYVFYLFVCFFLFLLLTVYICLRVCECVFCV